MEVASLLICVMSPPVCLPVKKLSDKRFMESNIVRFMSYTSFPATREVMMDESILMSKLQIFIEAMSRITNRICP